MQTDVMKKIDVLVEMAGSLTNLDTLQAELQEIEKETNKLRRELEFYLDNDNKYFKVSEKQVDENIKVSLEARIKRQQKSLKELQEQIDSESSDESSFHERILSLKADISSSNDYINVLNERIKITSDATTAENYKNILIEEKKHNEELIAVLNKTEASYAVILEKINRLNSAKSEIITSLDNNKNHLEITIANLNNPASYVDEELKSVEKEKLEEIEARIANLDKRKQEIITDPIVIADDAKNLIKESNGVGALSKVKELVSIVKSKPFMDVANGAEVEAMLQEELEISSSKRDSFASLIDSKDYSQIDTSIFRDRISFLNNQVEEFEEKIRLAREEIKKLDTTDFNSLQEKLDQSIKILSGLEEDIANYEGIMATNEDDKTPKRRAMLTAALKRKQDDLVNVKLVVKSYKEDQQVLVKRAYEIEHVQIVNYENNIKKIQTEINYLNSILENITKAKDVLAMESDKNKLRELDDMVKAVKHRQKYVETPTEILDEIDIYLSSINKSALKTESQNKENSFNFNSGINEINLKDLNSTEKVNNSFDNITPLNVNEIMAELPKIEDNNDNNPFLITDYKEETINPANIQKEE